MMGKGIAPDAVKRLFHVALTGAAATTVGVCGSARILGGGTHPPRSVANPGGPCSGKSSSLASFTQTLTERCALPSPPNRREGKSCSANPPRRGMDVYALPETPTIIMNAGFPYPGLARSFSTPRGCFSIAHMHQPARRGTAAASPRRTGTRTC